MDTVFRALADPTRRALLDELHRQDGQSLHVLEEHFEMTRFGVMKHLKLLEDAGPKGQRYSRDPGVVRSSPVSIQVLSPERIIGQPPYS